jgi:hypothetical protein
MGTKSVAIDKPSDTTIDRVQPRHNISDLPLYEGSWCRNVADAHLSEDALRLTRSGGVTLVGVLRYWDGGADGMGTPTHYAMLWPEFRAKGSRWRLKGVSVQAAEAARIGRDLLAHRLSRPGKNEPKRRGGKEGASDGGTLLGAPVGKNYLIFVKHMSQSAHWVRSRGIEVTPDEREAVAQLLTKLTKLASMPA